MIPSTLAVPTQAPLIGRIRGLLFSNYFILWLSLACFATLAPFTPGLATPNNLANLLLTLLPLFLVAIGQTLVLITGGIDLSQTSIIALTSVVGALAMTSEGGWLAGYAFAAPLLMLLLGSLAGLLNGVAVAHLRMPAFIVTLTSMMFWSGFAIWLTRSKLVGDLPASFNALGGQLWIALPVTLALGFFAHLMLSRSLVGRWLYAVGHNARTAHLSGVPVTATLITAYVASGFFAAAASILYTGQSETGSPVLGQRILLDIIGATVIGGTSLFGGQGKILWTFFGVLFLRLIDNSLNLLNLSFFSITMVKGGVILLAALLDTWRHRLAGGSLR